MEDIKQWLIGSKDYKEGVAIFAKYCRNAVMIRDFQTGIPDRNIKKLEFEMKMLLKIPVKMIFSQKCSNQQLLNTFYNTIIKPVIEEPKAPVFSKEKAKVKNENIPPIITESKELLKDLYTRISILHNDLYNLGESNDNKVVSARKKILAERSPLVQKYEDLYNLKEEFFITQKIPSGLTEIMNQNPIIISEEKKIDFNKLTDIELIKTKNRLSCNITKQQNKIDYQSSTKKDSLNPLPTGPIRDKAAKKLKDMKTKYKKVCEILKTRENAR